MFSMLLQLWGEFKALKPAFISKSPHFNFITIHYFWIVGATIITSVLLYPDRSAPQPNGMAYIDALFFASGACTQSGLNTIDVNKLSTYQQIVLFFVPMLCNPIAINTFVVFLRLYWFEKRFQHIAREAKTNRKSMSKSRSMMKGGERDIGKEEKGVNGRSIVVMHGTTRTNALSNDGIMADDLGNEHIHRTHSKDHYDNENAISSDESDGSRGESSTTANDQVNSEPHPQPQSITFADQVKRSDGLEDDQLRLPVQMSRQDHIAFLERQRNPEDRGVLRIPGPRDADAGVAPETVDEDEAVTQRTRRPSAYDARRPSSKSIGSRSFSRNNTNNGNNGDEHDDRRIQILEPQKPTEHMADDIRAASKTLGVLRMRKPRLLHGEKLHDSETHMSHMASVKSRAKSFASFKTAMSREKDEDMPYLSWQPTVGRNSAFVDLTEEQREELGGIEYRSLKSLALILVCYFWGFTLFGVVCLTPWIVNSSYKSVVTGDGQSPVWWGFFTTTSAFNDVGFTLTPDSMVSFQTAIWPLLLCSFLIIIGNTGFPIMLRVVIWVTSLYVPRESGIWEELKFLLDHPRRCFTLLFPSQATWWLFWILVVLNALDLIFFIILDLGNSVVTSLPVNIRVLDGWFQAVSTRTAGFGVVNLANLHPAIQVSYLIMMYISALPIAISVRRTNVYEEKSLGIYGSANEETEDEGEPSYVGAHLRRQLSFDLWYIFLGLFIISISEGHRIQSGDKYFTLFSILFEVVSAYGTVGLSLGYPTINASFSAEFGTIAKLVIIAMQIRGRHRGLPYELDRAILLPSESLHAREDQDATNRMRRRNSTSTFHTAGGNNDDRAAGGYNGVGNDNVLIRPPSNTGTSVSKERSGNFLSSLLHPGPTLPNSHRNMSRDHTISKGDSDFERKYSRTTMDTRSLSPRGRTRRMSGTDDAFDENAEKAEGRRSFYADGMNDP